MGRKQAKIMGLSLANVYKRLLNDFAFKICETCHEGGHGGLKGFRRHFQEPSKHFFRHNPFTF